MLKWQQYGPVCDYSCVFVARVQVNEGSALTAGALIAKLELDDPTKVKRAENFNGKADIWLSYLSASRASCAACKLFCVAGLTQRLCNSYLAGQLPNLGPPQVYCDRVDHKFTNALNAAKMIMAGEQDIAAWCDSLYATYADGVGGMSSFLS
jgi:hypothetical protein